MSKTEQLTKKRKPFNNWTSHHSVHLDSAPHDLGGPHPRSLPRSLPRWDPWASNPMELALHSWRPNGKTGGFWKLIENNFSGFRILVFPIPKIYESYIIILACMPSVIIRYDCTWKWEHENVPVEMHLPRYKLVIYMSVKYSNMHLCRDSAWAHVLAWVRSAMEFQRKWIGIGWRFQNCTQLCGFSVLCLGSQLLLLGAVAYWELNIRFQDPSLKKKVPKEIEPNMTRKRNTSMPLEH